MSESTRRAPGPRPHTTYPLRRIAAFEEHEGTSVIVLECGHAELGVPASRRYSRFFPCSRCHERLQAFRAEREAGTAAE